MSPISNGGGGGGGNAVISGVTVTGTAAASQVPVASSASAGAWAYPPGFEIGYDQITANVTSASTTEATGTTVITCGAHTFDGAAVLATFFAVRMQSGATNSSTLTVCLFESTTEIGRLCWTTGGSANSEQVPAIGMIRFTPTAGAHTYTVTCFHATSAGTVYAGAGGTGVDSPAFIRFTKV